MIFRYEEAGLDIYRPVIPIFLKSKSIFIFYRALIDSGADRCIFSKSIASLLEIQLSSKNKINFQGIGKGMVEGFLEKVMIRVGTINYEIEVVFAEISDFGHGILGHKGFLDHFNVNLRYEDLTIEVTPNSLISS